MNSKGLMILIFVLFSFFLSHQDANASCGLFARELSQKKIGEESKNKALEDLILEALKSDIPTMPGSGQEVSYPEFAFEQISGLVVERVFRRLLGLADSEIPWFYLESWHTFFQNNDIRFNLTAEFFLELLERSTYGDPSLDQQGNNDLKKTAGYLLAVIAFNRAEIPFRERNDIHVPQTLIDVIFTGVRTSEMQYDTEERNRDGRHYFEALFLAFRADSTVADRISSSQLEVLLNFMAFEGIKTGARSHFSVEALRFLSRRKTELRALLNQKGRIEKLRERESEANRLLSTRDIEQKREWLVSLFGEEFVQHEEAIIRHLSRPPKDPEKIFERTLGQFNVRLAKEAIVTKSLLEWFEKE